MKTTQTTTQTKKPSTIEMWEAGYRQHPTTKEWLPKAEVYAAVALLKNKMLANEVP